MLTHPHRPASSLRLDGMADAFIELQTQDHAKDLGLRMAGADARSRSGARGTQRFKSRLRHAKLRHGQASIEDVDYRTHGGSTSTVPAAGRCRWIAEHRNCCHRPCGVGKSWLSCAWHRKPAVTATPCITRACHACSLISNWRTVTAASHACSHAYQGRPADPRRLGPDRLNPNQRRDLMEIVEDATAQIDADHQPVASRGMA